MRLMLAVVVAVLLPGTVLAQSWTTTGEETTTKEVVPKEVTTEEITAAAVEDTPAPKVEAPPAPQPSPAPEADLEAGWDSKMGLLFALNNVFTNGAILSGYRGFGFGLQYNLGPTAALRMGLSLRRTTNPPAIRKTTTDTGSNTVVSYELDVFGPTATHGVTVGLDYVMRFGTSALAPYIGVGAGVDWFRADTRYTDDVTTVDLITTVDNVATSFALTTEGLFGVEWRVHSRISFYAEYGLRIDVIEWVADRSDTLFEDSSAGTAASTRTRSESRETRLLNFQLGLVQGASFGLMAHWF